MFPIISGLCFLTNSGIIPGCVSYLTSESFEFNLPVKVIALSEEWWYHFETSGWALVCGPDSFHIFSCWVDPRCRHPSGKLTDYFGLWDNLFDPRSWIFRRATFDSCIGVPEITGKPICEGLLHDHKQKCHKINYFQLFKPVEKMVLCVINRVSELRKRDLASFQRVSQQQLLLHFADIIEWSLRYS